MTSQGDTEDGQDQPQWRLIAQVFPEDINRRQTFALTSSGNPARDLVRLKIVFEESSDFFGRITLYNLELF